MVECVKVIWKKQYLNHKEYHEHLEIKLELIHLILNGIIVNNVIVIKFITTQF